MPNFYAIFKRLIPDGENSPVIFYRSIKQCQIEQGQLELVQVKISTN